MMATRQILKSRATRLSPALQHLEKKSGDHKINILLTPKMETKGGRNDESEHIHTPFPEVSKILTEIYHCSNG